MRKIIALILLIYISLSTSAQSYSAGLSYKFMYGNQWEKDIQSYNFSRPFLTDLQPLLLNGETVSVAHLFHSKHKIKQGIGLDYTLIRSTAKNTNYDNTLTLHLLDLKYILHRGQPDKGKFYEELSFSAIGSGLFRRVNGKPFKYVDSTRSKAFGVGGKLNFKLGYYIKLKDGRYFSPYVSVGFSPYIYAPLTESVINETYDLVSKRWTRMVSVQVGFEIFFMPKKVKSNAKNS